MERNMDRFRPPLTRSAVLMLVLTFQYTSFADERPKDENAQIRSDYKAAKAHCKELSGNDKEACMKKARAANKSAKAEARGANKSAKAQVREEREDDKQQTESLKIK